MKWWTLHKVPNHSDQPFHLQRKPKLKDRIRNHLKHLSADVALEPQDRKSNRDPLHMDSPLMAYWRCKRSPPSMYPSIWFLVFGRLSLGQDIPFLFYQATQVMSIGTRLLLLLLLLLPFFLFSNKDGGKRKWLVDEELSFLSTAPQDSKRFGQVRASRRWILREIVRNLNT